MSNATLDIAPARSSWARALESPPAITAEGLVRACLADLAGVAVVAVVSMALCLAALRGRLKQA